MISDDFCQVVDDVVAGMSRSNTNMEPPPDDAVPTEYLAEGKLVVTAHFPSNNDNVRKSHKCFHVYTLDAPVPMFDHVSPVVFAPLSDFETWTNCIPNGTD